MTEVGKTTLSIKLTPNESGHVGNETHIEGEIGDLLAAYVSLTKQLFDSITNDTEPGFAAHVFTKAQELILQECSFSGNVKLIKIGEAKANRVMPLLNILGKTFHMGGDE